MEQRDVPTMNPAETITAVAAGAAGALSLAKLWRVISPRQRRERREARFALAINGEKEAYCRRLEAIELQCTMIVAHLNRMERSDESIRLRLTALETQRTT